MDDALRLTEQAGFADVPVTRCPGATYLELHLVRGVKPAWATSTHVR